MDLDRCARRLAWSLVVTARTCRAATTSARCSRAILCSPRASSNMPARRSSRSPPHGRAGAPGRAPGQIEYRELEPILTIEDALAKEATVVPSHEMRRGEPERRSPPPAPHLGPHSDGRPGSLLSRGAGRARRAGRGRRHAGLELDPAPERGAAPDRRGARQAAQRGHGRGAAHGRRLRRQGDPGGAFACMARCSRAHAAPVKLGSIATTTWCSPASATTS